MKKVYQEIASRIQAMDSCKKSGNAKWLVKHENAINDIMSTAPSGSGIDNGTKLDLDRSTAEKLVFSCGFHHMNDNGMYDGWTEHTITVTPSLAFGFSLKISGRDRNDIKSYLSDVYGPWLEDNLIETYNKETESMSYNTESLKKAQEAYQAGIKNGSIQ